MIKGGWADRFWTVIVSKDAATQGATKVLTWNGRINQEARNPGKETVDGDSHLLPSHRLELAVFDARSLIVSRSLPLGSTAHPGGTTGHVAYPNRSIRQIVESLNQTIACIGRIILSGDWGKYELRSKI